MNSHPAFAEVAEALGDKVLDGLAEVARRTRTDLADYRALRPGWVADATERGLANWIHDRLWRHIRDVFDSVPDVVLYESGPTREIVIKSRYRIRIKRHHLDGHVSSFPTQTALDFFNEPVLQLTFEGMGEIRLAAGYEWDGELRSIGRAVLSLREGRQYPIWIEELIDRGDTEPTPMATPEGPRTPSRPEIKIGTGEAGVGAADDEES